MRAVVIRSRLKALRGGPPDLVLAHSPPFECHDASDTCHRGFRSFRGLIDAWQPAVFIHGHMHNYERSERETMIGRTRVIHVFPYTVVQVPLTSRDALAGHEVLPASGRNTAGTTTQLALETTNLQ